MHNNGLALDTTLKQKLCEVMKQKLFKFSAGSLVFIIKKMLDALYSNEKLFLQ